jgi:gliding motility-associated transport system permease protein
MTALRNVAALVEKEWRHYFGSPIAYVALSMWTLLFGFFFWVIFKQFLLYSMQMAQQMEMGGGFKLSLNDMVISPVLHNMAVVALFVLPMLTMRLFAEEKRQGTMELLATAPLTDLQIVMGKFLGAMALYTVMVAAGFMNFALLWKYATVAPEWKPVATGALALLLVGGAFIALGTFLSTLTRNQIVAGILGFGLSLIFWVLGWLDQPMADTVTKVVAYLGVTNHIEQLMKGIVDLKDLVFYASFIAFGLFLAHQSVVSQRWRA